MWQMIGVLAELERSLISEQTRAGVVDAKRRGVKFGRKRILTGPQLTHARKLLEQAFHPAPQSKTELTRLYGLGGLVGCCNLIA
jgi:DNA invertase Pin-like site-specific DNA recombinase